MPQKEAMRGVTKIRFEILKHCLPAACRKRCREASVEKRDQTWAALATVPIGTEDAWTRMMVEREGSRWTPGTLRRRAAMARGWNEAQEGFRQEHPSYQNYP